MVGTNVFLILVPVSVGPGRVQTFAFHCFVGGGDGQRHVDAEHLGQHLHIVSGAQVADSLPTQQLNEDV